MSEEKCPTCGHLCKITDEHVTLTELSNSFPYTRHVYEPIEPKVLADNVLMVYSPYDERHWLEVGLLLERERAGQDVRVRIVEEEP